VFDGTLTCGSGRQRRAIEISVARFTGLRDFFDYCPLGFRCAVHYHEILYITVSGHSLHLR
jgi:hypothetical protein